MSQVAGKRPVYSMSIELAHTETLPNQNELPWQNYRAYLDTPSRPQGMEVSGLTQEEFDRALQDPDTILIGSNAVTGAQMIPIATSLDNLTWYNKQYFEAVAEAAGLPADAPLVYYDHISGLFQRDPGQYIAQMEPLLRRLVAGRGLLLFDTHSAETEATLAELDLMCQTLGMVYRDVLPDFDPEARHYNFAAQVHIKDPEEIRRPPLDLFQASAQLELANERLESTISADPVLRHQDIQDVWSFYKAAFDELTAHDPMIASSPYQEFVELLQDPDVFKLVERSNSTVVTLCMFGDVRLFEWANQAYYAQAFPEEYEKGLVLFFPGVIRNPDSYGDARRVMAVVGRLLTTAGIETSVISFVCNKISRKPVSVISTWALNHTGIQADLRQPNSQKIFHAVQLS